MSKRPYNEWLLRVKTLLVYIGIIGADVHLCRTSWMHFYDDDYSPVQAVREDLEEGGIKMPPIRYSKVKEIIVNP